MTDKISVATYMMLHGPFNALNSVCSCALYIPLIALISKDKIRSLVRPSYFNHSPPVSLLSPLSQTSSCGHLVTVLKV